ncbi:MAG: nuclear transport factor 2 family protein [Bacteroidetes bacterium]|nr:nuclear transport factor 2 family protein [Bacteroidota bacterium]
MTSITSFAQGNAELSAKIIALEKAALEQWNNGNPSGYLNISAKDVVYFDPFIEQRLDGLDKLTTLYESIRGKVHADKYEMANLLVQSVQNMAVLTFNLSSYVGTSVHKWNCTEVYRLESDGAWKIIQSHWSLTKPNLNIKFED